jgi:diguanylate cyclase
MRRRLPACVKKTKRGFSQMSQRFAEQEDWRRKYSDALRAFEQESRLTQAQLDTLQKLVARLCVAAQGQSPRLDAELKRLKDAIRKDFTGQQLEPFSQAVADAVRELEMAASVASPLRVVASDGAVCSGSEVAVVAAPATPVTPVTPVASVASIAGATIDEAAAAAISATRIRAAMSQLIAELGRDPELSNGARALDQQLAADMPLDQMPLLIGKVGALVMLRITALEKSRQEIKTLLGQMMGQLDSVTRYIAGQTEEESQRNSSAETLNTQITGEMSALGANLDTGTDLDEIRSKLRERLFSISHHLQSFRQREMERAQQSRERSDGMRVRMEEMDLEVRKLQTRLSDEKRLLLMDALTQVPNRLAWDQRYAEERDRWQRFKQSTCIAVWDIDQFKSINDSYGHRAGDKVLAVVAEQLANSIRSTDFVARYGGEEFTMLLPGTSLEDAKRLVEHVRESIARIGFHFRGSPVSITISCGVTAMTPEDNDDEAFDRADKAMYRAKKSGRNRVVSA